MVATLSMRDAGVWKQPSKIYVKNAGAWVEPTGAWLKSNGVWERFWPTTDSTRTLNLDFTTMSTLDPRITFTRASTATYYDSAGVLRTAATNVPRLDFDPVTHVQRGLLIETSILNELGGSQDFSSGNYTKTGVTVTVNQTVAPDGATTADLITASATTAKLDQVVGVTGPYSQSVFAKKGTSDWIYLTGATIDTPRAWFNLATGTVGTIGAGMTGAAIQNVGNGWYRCSFSDIGDTGLENFVVGLSNADNSITVTVGKTVYLWGAQHEANAPVASSYVAAQFGSHAVDVAVMTGTNFSSWFNQSAGTFVVEFVMSSVGHVMRGIMSADNGAFAESYRLYGNTTNPKLTVTDNGIDQADLDAGTIAANVIYKLGFSYAANDIAVCINGGAVVTDTVAVLPTPTQLRIGYLAGTSEYLLGYIRRIQYFNAAKSDAELQALTAP